MKRTHESRRSTLPAGLKTLAAGVLFFFTAETLAAPPPHAPAHGWRAKNDAGHQHHHHRGHTRDRWEEDYGISSGRCNRDDIGTAIGGATGAVIGSRVGDGSTAAVLIGAVGGAVLGRMIGREMDRNDQACMGHALELAEPGQRVEWRNASDQQVQLTPGRTRDGGCRDFEMRIDGQRHSGKACPDGPGEWEIRG